MKKHEWKSSDMRHHIGTLKNFEGATVAAAKALADIQERNLFMEHYGSLKEFAEQELGWTKQRLYQILDFHKVRKSLPPESQPRLTSERVARPLKNVPEDKRAEVLEEAKRITIAAGKVGKPTAKSVEQAIEKIIQIDKIDLDKVDHVIPSGAAQKTWNRRDEVDEYMIWLSRIKSWAEKLQKTSDPFYAVVEFSAQEVYTDCGNLYRMIKNLVPYSICASCQGQAPKSCALCHGKGMISKHTWDHGVAKETKAMMKKKAEDDAPQRLSATGG